MSASTELQGTIRMNGTILLRKLIAIERMIGKVDSNTLRNLIYDAEDYLIQMQSAECKSFFREAISDEQTRLELIG